MNEQELISQIIGECKEQNGQRYLPCGKAFQIADACGVNPVLIGQLCNREQIKVKSCQLGCF